MKKFSVIMFAMFAFVCAKNASAGDKAKKGIDVAFSQKQVTELCDERVKICKKKLEDCDEESQVCGEDLDQYKVKLRGNA